MASRLAAAGTVGIEGARAYWNDRPDPLHWTGRRGAPADGGWQRAYDSFLAPATRAAIDALGDLRGRRVLELACAQGYGSLHLAERGATVVGVDLSDARCRAARDRLAPRAEGDRLRFLAADAERLPFADGSFDAVFARDVLMYADPGAVVRACARVVRRGGPVAFVESLAGPPGVGPWRRLTESPDYRRMTRHLRWDELGGLGGGLEGGLALELYRPYYLLSTAAFAVLFFGGSPRWHRRLLDACGRIDGRLLGAFPALARWAWRGVAVYRRPARAAVP